MDEKEKLLQELTEAHSDLEPIETGNDDKGNDVGGDTSANNAEDASTGDEGDSSDTSNKSDDLVVDKNEEEAGADEDESAESDDSGDSEAKRVGEKGRKHPDPTALAEKKALEEQRAQLEEKYSQKIAEEQKQRDLMDDPIYKVEDFIGTLGEDGEVLSDSEATARFRAWEADKKLRDYQKGQVMKEQAETLVKLQGETAVAFEKFPEFNANSDKYDAELAEIANEAFTAGLVFQSGHEGDNNYIIDFRINPGQLLEKLHNKYFKEAPVVTKVNNLGDDNGTVVSTKQVTKKANKYEPGFRGEVDRELDKLIKQKEGK